MHRSWPCAHRSIPLDVEIGLGLVDDLRKSNKLASIPCCTADILQLEHNLDNLTDGLLRKCGSRTVVEASTVEVVRCEWAARVHDQWIREVKGLHRDSELEALSLNPSGAYIDMCVPETSPDAITGLNLHGGEAGSLGDSGIHDCFSPQTGELRL